MPLYGTGSTGTGTCTVRYLYGTVQVPGQVWYRYLVQVPTRVPGLHRPTIMHVSTRPLQLPTERDELALLHGIVLPASVPPALMLEVSASSTEPVSHWPCGTVAALTHPGLPGVVRRSRSLGYTLSIDESLRTASFGASTRGNTAALSMQLRTIGGYFSPRRACIGLAADSAWHEAVHEMTHATFDARVRRADVLSRWEPLRVHYERQLARGYSKRMAEEMVCRAHELHALRSSGALWRWAGRAWLVWDNALFEAANDLAAVNYASRSAAQEAEMRRVAWLRTYLSGPTPRLATVISVAIGASVAAAAVGRHALDAMSTCGGMTPKREQ